MRGENIVYKDKKRKGKQIRSKYLEKMYLLDGKRERYSRRKQFFCCNAILCPPKVSECWWCWWLGSGGSNYGSPGGITSLYTVVMVVLPGLLGQLQKQTFETFEYSL